jgi:hypothetical protein
VKSLVALGAAIVAAVTLAGNASAMDAGVVDDYGIAPENATWFFDSLGDLGMRENRITGRR